MTTSVQSTPLLLSPITFGLHTDLDPTAVMKSVWNAAIDSVPQTQPLRNRRIQDGKRVVQKPFTHTSQVQLGGGEEYPWSARLCYGLPNASATDRWKNWYWKTGARLVTDTTRQIPDTAATLRLDTTGYRLRAGHIEAAAELALFRHYVALGIQAIDPNVTITGDTDWHDDWWRLPPETTP